MYHSSSSSSSSMIFPMRQFLTDQLPNRVDHTDKHGISDANGKSERVDKDNHSGLILKNRKRQECHKTRKEKRNNARNPRTIPDDSLGEKRKHGKIGEQQARNRRFLSIPINIPQPPFRLQYGISLLPILGPVRPPEAQTNAPNEPCEDQCCIPVTNDGVRITKPQPDRLCVLHDDIDGHAVQACKCIILDIKMNSYRL